MSMGPAPAAALEINDDPTWRVFWQIVHEQAPYFRQYGAPPPVPQPTPSSFQPAPIVSEPHRDRTTFQQQSEDQRGIEVRETSQRRWVEQTAEDVPRYQDTDNNALASEKREAKFSITPRFQYLSLHDSESNDESGLIPFFGVTAGYYPQQSKYPDFLLSMFYGKGSHRHNLRTSSEKDYKITRIDAEALFRNTLKDSNVNLFYGGRWLQFHSEARLRQSGETFSNGTNESEETINVYLGELGIGFSTPVTNDGRHVLFSSIMVGPGWAWKNDDGDNSDYFVLVTDMNIGYNYSFTQSISAHARYRAVFFSDEDFFENAQIAHGPEIGLTYRF